MREYHKIETVFERSTDGDKCLQLGKFRNPTVEFLKDLPWQFTEKLDGTNTRVCWDGHKVSYGGRTDRAQMPAPLMNYLVSVFGTQEVEELFEQTLASVRSFCSARVMAPRFRTAARTEMMCPSCCSMY